MTKKIAATIAAVAAAAVLTITLAGCTGTAEKPETQPKPEKTSSAAPTPETTEAPTPTIPEGATPISNVEGVAYTLPVTFADGQNSAVIQGQTVTCDADGQTPAPSTVLFSADDKVVSVACSYYASDADNDTLNGMDWGAEG